MKCSFFRSIVIIMIRCLWIGSIQFINAQVPAYETESWVHTSGPLGGMGYDIRYNFDDPSIWYVTDAWAGFFISMDSGVTWTSSNEGITARKSRDAIPVFCATVDPHDPQIIWIGTENTGDIFKSTNGGNNWTLKRNGVGEDQQALTFRGFTVDPRTSDIVYAMAEIGSFGWTPNHEPRKGIEMDLSMGIVFKTIDGGENWIEIWRGNNLARYCWIHPKDPEIIYISTGIFDRESALTDTAAGIAGGVGILKSKDGGQTWKILNEANGLLDLYVGSLYMHPHNPDTLLAAASQNNWSGFQGVNTEGVYITTDGGENWTRVIDRRELFGVVEYSTTNPDIAYAISSAAVYRSNDAGFTWQRFSGTANMWGPPGIVAGFPIDAQCDPRDPMRIIVNNYLGGNLLSEDGGETWMNASKGYTGALVNHISVVPEKPWIVYAGSRSGIYCSENGGEDWIGLVYPPGDMWAKFNEILAVTINPMNPSHILTMPNDFGTILYSYNGGTSWNVGTMTDAIHELLFAPSNPSIVYAASKNGFWQSTDGGENFNFIHEEIISAMAVHPTNSQILFASTINEGLLKTTDGGQSWDAIGTGLPDLEAHALVIHPLNPDLMFAGISSESPIGGQGIYRSLDAGETWTAQVAGMEPNARIMKIVVAVNNLDVIYACAHFNGVYVSTNGGDTWMAINEGLDHQTMNSLALSDDGSVLYAATMGAGVYRLGDVPETAVFNNQSNKPSEFILKQNYPNPFNHNTVISYQTSAGGRVEVKVLNLMGQTVSVIVNETQSAGEYRIIWDASDQVSGIYLIQMKIGDIVRHQKGILLK
ncbi:T9SS type A sorting domain-containing protein [bacterium]